VILASRFAIVSSISRNETNDASQGVGAPIIPFFEVNLDRLYN
jgi:hypothetical protein